MFSGLSYALIVLFSFTLSDFFLLESMFVFIGRSVFCLGHPPERPPDAGWHPEAPERREEDGGVGHTQTAVSAPCRLGKTADETLRLRCHIYYARKSLLFHL